MLSEFQNHVKQGRRLQYGVTISVRGLAQVSEEKQDKRILCSLTGNRGIIFACEKQVLK
jgi:hypothetical protein